MKKIKDDDGKRIGINLGIGNKIDQKIDQSTHTYYGIDTEQFNTRMDGFVAVLEQTGVKITDKVKDFVRSYMDSVIFSVDTLRTDLLEDKYALSAKFRENFSELSAAGNKGFKEIAQKIGELKGDSAKLNSYIEAKMQEFSQSNTEVLRIVNEISLSIFGLKNDYKKYAGDMEKALSNVNKLSRQFDDDNTRKEIAYQNAIRRAWTYLCLAKFDSAFGEFKFARSLKGDGHEAYFGMALAAHKIQLLDVYNENGYEQIPICCALPYEEINGSFREDPLYDAALEYAKKDKISYENYAACGKAIEDITCEFKAFRDQGLVYDCFICCKVGELDSDNAPIENSHTKDCEWAMELFEKLKGAGLRPFFSEGIIAKQIKVLAKQYEAHILYALFNAKCMIIVCSEQRYLDNSRYMQNECLRFAAFSREKGNKDLSNMLVVRTNAQHVSPRELWGRDHQDIIRDSSGKYEDLIFDLILNYVREKVSGNAYYSSIEKICPVCGKVYAKDDAVCSKAECNGAKLVLYNEYIAIKTEHIHQLESAAANNAEELNKQAGEKLSEAETRAKQIIDEAKASAQKTLSEAKAMAAEKDKEIAKLKKEIERQKLKEQELTAERKKAAGQNSFAKLEKYDKTEFKLEGTKLIEYTGKKEEAVIPVGVTSIGAGAFLNNNHIKSINIPASTTSIYGTAFNGCGALESIIIDQNNPKYHVSGNCLINTATKTLVAGCSSSVIPADGSVTAIGYRAFKGCGVKNVIVPETVKSIGSGAFSECDLLEEVIVPDGVQSIGNDTFYECTALKKVSLPQSVTNIGSRAFCGCKNLADIEIPANVAEIGEQAFKNCNAILNITLLKGITSIGASTFEDCSNLKSITIPEGVTLIDDSAFSGCSSLKSITIPEGVTAIGDSAFSGCSGLESITIPEGVTSIGGDSFRGCSSLTDITIPRGVTSIEHDTFNGCSSLRSINIPEGVTYIGDSAFKGCGSLVGITIPQSVTTICGWVFAGCSGLESITVAEGNKVYHSSGNCLIKTENNQLILGCNNSVIPSYITSIWSYAFENCGGLTSITIPASVTSIGRSAFKGCSGLKDIAISEGVTSIGESAFEGCSDLESITIPKGITSISGRLFYGCACLESVTIPQGVTSIGEEAFYGCTCLESVAIPQGVTSIRREAFSGCSSLTSIIFPQWVTSIGYSAFRGCRGLTSVVIPTSVTSMGREVFVDCDKLTIYCALEREPTTWPFNWAYNWNGGCKVVWGYKEKVDVAKSDKPKQQKPSLKYNKFQFKIKGTVLIRYRGKGGHVEIPEGVTLIRDNAFFCCSGLTSITIPEGVTSIGDRAFFRCTGLKNITIPEGVTSIGDFAFSGCSGLTSITIPEGVTAIGDSAFSWCSGLTSITIPESVTSIGGSAFKDCSGLTSITIPEGVTSIGDFAFFGCSGLTSITIPEGVTSIGDFAFSGCSGLTSITIPEGVTSIGGSAFEGCSGLTSITIPEGVTSIGDSAFNGCNGLTSITIPQGVTSIGNRAFYGCSGLTSITIPEGVTSIGDFAFYGCTNLTIYCRQESKPEDWEYYWKYNCEVVWGYKGE